MTEARVTQVHADRVTAGEFLQQAERFSVLRLETALERLGGDTDELLERLDAARDRRNEASYRAGFVPEASVSEAREATRELLDRARDFLSSTNP